MITVSQLHIYPLKSAQSIPVTNAGFDAEGMLNDRRLMAVDEKGIFITARSTPELLHLSCQIDSNGWKLSHPAQDSSCTIPSIEFQATPTQLTGQVWRDEINAIDAGDEAAVWLSEILGQTARIALWKPNARRSGKYNLETSFADEAPILIASEASMKQGCNWGGIPYDTRRFRPNIVIDGIEAFAEESWKEIQIGDVKFEVLDICVRCILTTRDPDTGIAHPEKQPMKALMEMHSNDAGQPLMGINVRLASEVETAIVSIGDKVSFS